MACTIETFTCISCGQRFDWKPELASRKLACVCGNVITVPVSPPPPVENTTYRLREDGEEPVPGRLQLDAAGQEVQPAPQVLEYRRATYQDREIFPEHVRGRIRNIWVPLAVVLLSLLILVGESVGFSPAMRKPISAILYELAIRSIWNIGVILLAGRLLGWLLDTGLGDTFRIAALKLAAIALSQSAVSALLAVPIGKAAGDLLGSVAALPVLLLLLRFLFEFDLSELAIAVTLITLMQWTSYFGLRGLL